MKRIIIHWTAGGYQPNSTDFEHYHYLINGDGLVIKGNYDVEDNENCADGKYAAHTGGGNTGSIGIAMCGMLGFKNRGSVGKFPLKARQIESCLKLCAQLAKAYDIPVENIITHYEFGKLHPDTSSAGKIDIIYLPPYTMVKQNEVGGFLRYKIRNYYN